MATGPAPVAPPNPGAPLPVPKDSAIGPPPIVMPTSGPAFPALPATFPQDILLDSGALYTGANGSGVLLARTRRGMTFDPGRAIGLVGFDGERAPVQGLHHITEYKATIKGRLLQFNTNQYPIVEPGIQSMSGSTGGINMIYYMQIASQLFAAGAYFSNLRWIFRRADLSFWQVRFGACLCEKYTIVSQDKDAAEIECSFAACLNMAAVNPFTGATATTDDAPYGFETFPNTVSVL